MTDVNINLQCNHRRGLLYLTNPWAWGRPCRRCRRFMSRNVVVVQPQMVQPAVSPAQTAVNWQQQQLQVQQQQQFQQQQTASALPPKYDQAVAAQ